VSWPMRSPSLPFADGAGTLLECGHARGAGGEHNIGCERGHEELECLYLAAAPRIGSNSHGKCEAVHKRLPD
jgi:hypothetical protein